MKKYNTPKIRIKEKKLYPKEFISTSSKKEYLRIEEEKENIDFFDKMSYDEYINKFKNNAR
jgi:hypothetical protein